MLLRNKFFSRVVKVLILLPNVPGFLPFGGDIKNTWLLFVPFLFERRVSAQFAYIFLFMLLLVLVWGMAFGFSLKYVVVLFIPLMVKALMSKVLFKREDFMFIVYALFVSVLLAMFGVTIFNSVFDFVFGNGSGVNPLPVYRGHALISTEPSHIAPLIILLVHFSRYYVHGYKRLFVYVVVLLSALITGSGSLLLYFLVYMSTFLFAKKYRKYAVYMLIAFVSAVLLGFLPERMSGIISVFYDIVSSGSLTVESTAKFASGRFISNYVWLHSVASYPFGFGFQVGVKDFLDMASILNVNYKVISAYSVVGVEGLPVMPRSFLALCVAVFGFFGFIVFFLYLYYFLNNRMIVDYPLFVIGLFYLVVVGFVGSPFGWVAVYLSSMNRLR